jgi:hypothetical protein
MKPELVISFPCVLANSMWLLCHTVHRASHIYDALYVIYFTRSTLLYIFYMYQMNIKVN